jgi:predicted aspartyl protease
MKKSIVTGMIGMMFVMGSINGQTQMSDKEWEEAKTGITEWCQKMAKYMLPEDAKMFLEQSNISTECFCRQLAEAIIKLLQQKKADVSSMSEIEKLTLEIMDENSEMHNEYASELMSRLDKHCGEGSSSGTSVGSGPASAEVSLIRYGEMYKVKLTVGSSSKYYLMDSGASHCIISRSYARELEDLNIIKADSYIESGYYQLADGSEVLCRRVVLNNVKLGGFVLDGVVFAITEKEVGFILGKEIMNAFASWNINNSKSVLELVK